MKVINYHQTTLFLFFKNSRPSPAFPPQPPRPTDRAGLKPKVALLLVARDDLTQDTPPIPKLPIATSYI